MEAGGGFVQDAEGLASIPLGQFPSQLNALRFTARQGDGRLAQFDLAQAHVHQGPQDGG